MLVLGRNLRQSIQIGDSIRVKILSIDGNYVRVGIKAPREVQVSRPEQTASVRRQAYKESEEPGLRSDSHLGLSCIPIQFESAVMAHQHPPKEPFLQFQIPRPADPEALQDYLALGWYELGDELRWSHARGTPVHPGDAAHLDESEWKTKWGIPPAPPLLSVLPLAVLSEGQSRLPPAAECREAYLEVPVMVLIKYRRMESRKGRSRHSFWTADEAKLIAGAAEPPAD